MAEEKKKRGRKPKTQATETNPQMKTLNNTSSETAKANVLDIKVFGNPDAWKLICKASSKSEGWMKSTKAMNIPGAGCIVQVSTQQGNSVAEDAEFIKDVMVKKSQISEGYYLVGFGQKNISEEELINSNEV